MTEAKNSGIVKMNLRKFPDLGRVQNYAQNNLAESISFVCKLEPEEFQRCGVLIKALMQGESLTHEEIMDFGFSPEFIYRRARSLLTSLSREIASEEELFRNYTNFREEFFPREGKIY